jgi:NADH-quinone oxidoreductase subunit A
MLAVEGGIELVQGMTVFVIAGVAMVFGALLFGHFLRPRVPHPDKAVAYECGEPSFGTSWVQFDLRFYVVALVFLVFDVEVALFYPWAVVYGGGAHHGAAWEVLQQVKAAALYDMLFFFGVIVVGFLYLWRFGYLDWVRAVTGGGRIGQTVPPPPAPQTSATV